MALPFKPPSLVLTGKSASPDSLVGPGYLDLNFSGSLW